MPPLPSLSSLWQCLMNEPSLPSFPPSLLGELRATIGGFLFDSIQPHWHTVSYSYRPGRRPAVCVCYTECCLSSLWWWAGKQSLLGSTTTAAEPLNDISDKILLHNVCATLTQLHSHLIVILLYKCMILQLQDLCDIYATFCKVTVWYLKCVGVCIWWWHWVPDQQVCHIWLLEMWM